MPLSTEYVDGGHHIRKSYSPLYTSLQPTNSERIMKTVLRFVGIFCLILVLICLLGGVALQSEYLNRLATFLIIFAGLLFSISEIPALR